MASYQSVVNINIIMKFLVGHKAIVSLCTTVLSLTGCSKIKYLFCRNNDGTCNVRYDFGLLVNTFNMSTTNIMTQLSICQHWHETHAEAFRCYGSSNLSNAVPDLCNKSIGMRSGERAAHVKEPARRIHRPGKCKFRKM